MNPTTYEKIEAYLTKRLSDTDRHVLETAIQSNEELKEEVVRMQLLRKITERNIIRNKLLKIHEVKVKEWHGHFFSNEEQVESVKVIPQTEIPVSEITEIDAEQESTQEYDSAQETVEPEPQNETAEVVLEEIVEIEVQEEQQDTVGDITATKVEEPEEVQDHVEETESVYVSKSSVWKPLLLSLGVLSFLCICGFVYLAKTPVTIREGNPGLTAEGIELDSLQNVYLGVYNQGKTAFENNKYYESIPHFNEVIAAQELPNYYNDAALFLGAVANTAIGPNTATKQYKVITSKKIFNYPYTNKDKLQLWCKIQWAKLMGLQD